MADKFKIGMTYQPKGSMCMACAHLHRDCSRLPFSTMQALAKNSGTVIVRCTEFVQAPKKGGAA